MSVTQQQVVEWILANGKNGSVQFDSAVKSSESVVVGHTPRLDEDGNYDGVTFEPVIEEHEFQYEGVSLFGRTDITLQKKQARDILDKYGE